eukprot:gene11971-12341_t
MATSARSALASTPLVRGATTGAPSDSAAAPLPPLQNPLPFAAPLDRPFTGFATTPHGVVPAWRYMSTHAVHVDFGVGWVGYDRAQQPAFTPHLFDLSKAGSSLATLVSWPIPATSPRAPQILARALSDKEAAEMLGSAPPFRVEVLLQGSWAQYMKLKDKAPQHRVHWPTVARREGDLGGADGPMCWRAQLFDMQEGYDDVIRVMAPPEGCYQPVTKGSFTSADGSSSTQQFNIFFHYRDGRCRHIESDLDAPTLYSVACILEFGREHFIPDWGFLNVDGRVVNTIQVILNKYCDDGEMRPHFDSPDMERLISGAGLIGHRTFEFENIVTKEKRRLVWTVEATGAAPEARQEEQEEEGLRRVRERGEDTAPLGRQGGQAVALGRATVVCSGHLQRDTATICRGAAPLLPHNPPELQTRRPVVASLDDRSYTRFNNIASAVGLAQGEAAWPAAGLCDKPLVSRGLNSVMWWSNIALPGARA